MANFPIFHGITLAENSWIENLNVEVLAADPIPVAPGRVWFNSTDKVFKYSGLDATGGVVVRSFASAEELNAQLAALDAAYKAADAAEAVARAAADAQTLSDAEAYTDAAKAEAIAYTDAVKAELLGGIPPETLDTLTELATALQNNPDIVNVLKQYSDDAIAAAKAEIRGDVSGAFDTLAELEAGLAQEVTDRQAAVSAEEDARVAADASLDARITTVEGQVNGNIGNLATLHTDDKTNLVAAINEVQDEIQAEVSRATSAEGTLTTNLAAEVTRATAAEAGLQSAIDAEVAARVAAVAAEATARTDADTALQTAIGDEQARATAAEAGLQAAIDAEAAARAAAVTAEANARTAADVTLQGNIDAEASARVAGDAAVQAALDAEIAARTAADNSEATARAAGDAALQAAVDAEVARATAAESAEATARADGDAAIRTAYNAKRFTFQSQAAASTHIVAHNLGAAFVNFTVLVERPDGKYRNDVVSVEEVDTNTLKVYLSTAMNVKVAVESMGAL